MPAFLDLTGHKTGRLTAQWPVGIKGRHIHWLCLCVCGNLRIVASTNLVKPNHTTSCGCYQRQRVSERSKIHGHCWARPGNRKSHEYQSWMAMKVRCTNPGHPGFKNYGGRGIKVCARWMNSFANFLADMGPQPKTVGPEGKRSLYTLDRYPNPDGNYEPGNCRWATWKQQANNRNKRKRRVSNVTNGG